MSILSTMRFSAHTLTLLSSISSSHVVSALRLDSKSQSQTQKLNANDGAPTNILEINTMLLNKMNQLDGTKAECAGRDYTTKLRAMDQIIEELQTRVTELSADLINANGAQKQKEMLLAKSKSDQESAWLDCKKTEKELKEELSNIMSDVNTTTSVLKSACPNKISSSSFAQLGMESTLRAKVSMLKARKLKAMSQSPVEMQKCMTHSNHSSNKTAESGSVLINSTGVTTNLLQGTGEVVHSTLNSKTLSSSSSSSDLALIQRLEMSRHKHHFSEEDELELQLLEEALQHSNRKHHHHHNHHKHNKHDNHDHNHDNHHGHELHSLISISSGAHKHLQSQLDSLKTHAGRLMAQQGLRTLTGNSKFRVLSAFDKNSNTEIFNTLKSNTTVSSTASKDLNCLPATQTNCNNLETSMTQLIELAAANAKQKKEQMAKHQHQCRKDSENSEILGAQLLDEYNSLSSRIAKLTSELAQGREELELEEKKRSDLENEQKIGLTECESSMVEINAELDRLRKIRGDIVEIMKLGTDVLPVDCELTEFKYDINECTRHCEGSAYRTAGSNGNINYDVALTPSTTFSATREIVTPSNKFGVQCKDFSLLENRKCPKKLQECGKDCLVSEWSGWSECSAHCGSGVMHRNRNVVRPSENNGKSCPNLNDMTTCSSRSCNSDCVLSDWSSMDECSQTCGTGLQMKTRSIVSNAFGTGSCPAADSKERKQLHECVNYDPSNSTKILKCGVYTGSNFAKCNAKLDIVLLVDSSADITDVEAQNEGKAIESMLKSINFSGEDKVKMSVVTVAGVSYTDAANAALKESLNIPGSSTGSGTTGSSPSSSSSNIPQLTYHGNTKTLLQWSSDLSAIQSAIKSASQGGEGHRRLGTFDIWSGLTQAKALFNSPGARRAAGAQPIVLVVTEANFVPDYEKSININSSDDMNLSVGLATGSGTVSGLPDAKGIFLKVGALNSLGAKAWTDLSKAMNSGGSGKYPKATINRTVYNFKDWKSMEEKVVEKVIPSMCGRDLSA